MFSLAQKRKWKDRLWYGIIASGAFFIILLVLTMFVFLFKQALPLFQSPEFQYLDSVLLSEPLEGELMFLSTDEQNNIAISVTDAGIISFFDIKTGRIIQTHHFPDNWIDFSSNHANSNEFAILLDDGSVQVYKPVFEQTFHRNAYSVHPKLTITYEDSVFKNTKNLHHFIFRVDQKNRIFAAHVDNAFIQIVHYTGRTNLVAQNTRMRRRDLIIPSQYRFDHIKDLKIDKNGGHIYLLDHQDNLTAFNLKKRLNKNTLSDKQLEAFPLSKFSIPVLDDQVNLRKLGASTIKAMHFVTGENTLMFQDKDGYLLQLTLTTDHSAEGKQTQFIVMREFKPQKKLSSPIDRLIFLGRKKDFIISDSIGHMLYYNTTSEKLSIKQFLFPDMKNRLSGQKIDFSAVSPRGNLLLIKDKDFEHFHLFKIQNPHANISWKILWGKIFYEHYEGPEYIWQSTGGSSDYESKFSLVPLTFGTIKAAFYALILAIPLAILNAIYTAFFMPKSLRRIIKPTIELIEAFPTVIIGFLAGIFLAPLMEAHLLHFIIITFLMPLSIICFGFIWNLYQTSVSEGWYGIILIPFVLLFGYILFQFAELLEYTLFNGDFRLFLIHNLGMDWNQRNALVIGVAMGFAVIPTIFSITEDALYNVPSHLVLGSYAMGANRWHTIIHIVLPTASPAIFSAVVIGFGRAVGDTMIVLMASGNTPLIDWSAFLGMRTLAANIAIEIPEAEAFSSHYRVLFLSGLVLFAFTFLINMFSEMIRQRLRKRYGKL